MALKELVEARGKLHARSTDLNALFNKKNSDGALDWSNEDHERYQSLEKEAADLHDEVEKWKKVEEAQAKNTSRMADLEVRRHPSEHGRGRGEIDQASFEYIDEQRFQKRRKSVGQLVTETDEFKRFDPKSAGGNCQIELKDYEFKTTFAESAGFAPANFRGPDIVPFALMKVVIQDLMPQITTDERSAIKYMQETTNTNNAAPTAEAATKPEDAFAYTEIVVPIQVIASSLPITEQQLADVPQIQGILTNSLAYHVMLAEQAQILNGNGTSPQLQGFLTKTGVLNVTCNTNIVTSAYKAMVQVRFTGFAEPTAIIWNPLDWQTVRTLQDSVGRYVMGDPSLPGPDRIWGVPVVQTPSIAQGTALTGDFATFAYLARRMGLTVKMGWVNAQFVQNMRTVLAEIRSCLVIRRAAAFATLTSIPAGS